jgi:hypothetical protein
MDIGGGGSELNCGSVVSYTNESNYPFDETASTISGSRRPSFLSPSAAGGSGAGGNSSSYNHFNSSHSEIMSLSLQDIDENVESSLLDPSSSGIVFMKLLVKTIGGLRCEEDVERLLHETIFNGFSQVILPKIRNAAQANLARHLSHLSSSSHHHKNISVSSPLPSSPLSSSSSTDNDSLLKLHGRLFHRYVSCLLDALFTVFHRSIYVYKLLAVSKLGGGISSYGDGRGGNNEISNTVVLLPLDYQKKIVSILSALLSQMEECVIDEMEIHLVEIDVQNISDQLPASSSSSRKYYQNNEDEEEDLRGGRIRGAADGNNAKGTRFSTDRLIYAPSIWHASGLYSKIFKFNIKVTKLLYDSFDESMILSSLSSLPSPSPSPSHSASSIDSFQSTLLSFIKRQIEQELIPVVQSWVFKELRDLEERGLYSVTNDTIAVRQAQQLLAAQQAGHNEKRNNDSNSSKKASASFPIIAVTSICQTLLKLWNQLFNHRDFIGVVYDRLLKTVYSMIKEAQESLSFSLNIITFLSKIHFGSFLSRDFNYSLHKQRHLSHFRILSESLGKQQISSSSSDSSNNSNSLHQNRSFKGERNDISGPDVDLHELYVEEFATLQCAFRELQGLPIPKVKTMFFTLSSLLSSLVFLVCSRS